MYLESYTSWCVRFWHVLLEKNSNVLWEHIFLSFRVVWGIFFCLLLFGTNFRSVRFARFSKIHGYLNIFVSRTVIISSITPGTLQSTIRERGPRPRMLVNEPICMRLAVSEMWVSKHKCCFASSRRSKKKENTRNVTTASHVSLYSRTLKYECTRHYKQTGANWRIRGSLKSRDILVEQVDE